MDYLDPETHDDFQMSLRLDRAKKSLLSARVLNRTSLSAYALVFSALERICKFASTGY